MKFSPENLPNLFASKKPKLLWQNFIPQQWLPIYNDIQKIPTHSLKEEARKLINKDTIFETKIAYLLFILLSHKEDLTFRNVLELGYQLTLISIDFFYFAILCGNIAFFEYIKKIFPEDFETFYRINFLALAEFATSLDQLEMAKLLFGYAKDPQEIIRRDNFKILLDTAAWADNSITLKYLIDVFLSSIKGNKNQITFLTDAPHKSFGDASAAAKLIRALLESHPAIKINWFICESSKTLEVKDIIPENISVQIVANWYELLTKDNLEILANSKKIIAFPTFNYLPASIIYIVSNIAKIEAISEYNVEVSPLIFLNINQYTSGLGKQALGIFYSPKPELVALPQTLLPVVMPNLEKQNPYDLQNNRVFFSYTAKRQEHAINIFDRTLFILSCMNLIKEGNITIFAQVNPADINILINKLRKQDPKTLFIFKFNQDPEQSFLPAGVSQSNRTVFIVNPFPLNHKIMLQLLYYSNPFCQVTGDQSMSEALSFAKLPLYQCMAWKKEFFEQVQEIAKTIGDELWRFFILFPYKKSFKNIFITPPADQTENAKILTNYLLRNEEKLLTQAQKFSKLIATKYNLSKALVKICNEDPEELPLVRHNLFSAKTKQVEIEETSKHKDKKIKVGW